VLITSDQTYARGDHRAARGTTLTGATTPIWYVTFEVQKRGMLPRQRSPRETKTFATEDEAKTFARSKVEQGLIAYAGTINPHTPKQLISSSQIHAWLTGERSDEPPYGENKE
jgi:hypothetical protein